MKRIMLSLFFIVLLIATAFPQIDNITRYKKTSVSIPLRDSVKEAVDESTDTYDAIDWLVKNIPNNSGRAGIVGVSIFKAADSDFTKATHTIYFSAQYPTYRIALDEKLMLCEHWSIKALL